MSCMSASLTRVGGSKATLTRVDGNTTVSLGRIGGKTEVTSRLINNPVVSLDRVGGNTTASLRRIGQMSCRLSLVCSSGVVIHYLEIEPTMIWVYPDFEVDNNVYSNTLWNVD